MLRPYQVTAVDAVVDSIDKRPCLVMPTGSGKTYVAVEIVKRLGLRCLWIAHRRELIAQAVGSLHRAGVKRAGVVMAGAEPDYGAPIQVASVQTAVRRDPIPDIGLIVVDEAHHARATTYQRVIERYPPGVPVLGLTATPFRTDGRGLGDIFGAIVVGAWPDDLVAAGTLIEPVVYVPQAPDLSGVKVTGGDYNLGELGAVMRRRKLVGNVVDEWSKRTPGTRTVVFAVNVEHSREIVRQFRARGVVAEHLDEKTPAGQRDGILARLRAGYTSVVSNCQVLTEGWDLPALVTAIIARPTASLCLHLQMVGRIMRSAEGKAGATVLDHAGNHLRHGTVTQRIEYSLEDAARGAATDRDGEAPMKRCPECYLLVRPGAQTCPECGSAFRTDAVKHAEGHLVQFGPRDDAARPSIGEQQRAWSAIDRQRVARGFKEGWSYYRFEGRFGFRPLIYQGVVCDPATCGQHVRRAVFGRFVRHAEERGFKRGWAAHQYKAVFGDWPQFRQVS